MNQPSFWLKVSDELVIAHFDSLLTYLKNYNYVKDSKDTDFTESCNHLISVANKYADIVINCEIHKMPVFDIEQEEVFRIFAGAILTEQKTGLTDHHILIALIKLILHSKQEHNTETLSSLLKILKGCAFELNVDKLGFSWRDIEDFNKALFVHRLAQIRFRHKDKNDEIAIFECHGTMIINSENVFLSPLRLNEIKKNNLHAELQSNVGIKIQNTKVQERDKTLDIFELVNPLLSSFKNINTPQKYVKKDYELGDKLIVEIEDHQGGVIHAKSIDSRYNTLCLPLSFLDNIAFIEKKYWINNLVPGSFLKVIYRESTFWIDIIAVNEFIENYAEDIIQSENPDVLGIYMGDYKAGTRWLTETGMFVSINSNTIKSISGDEFEIAKQNKLPCWIRLKSTSQVGKPGFEYQVVNGFISELEEEAEFDIDEAFNVFMEEILSYFKEEAGSVPQEDESSKSIIPVELIRTMALLVFRSTSNNLNSDTTERIESLIISMAIICLLGNDATKAEYEFLNGYLKYLREIVKFANGKMLKDISIERTENNDPFTATCLSIIEELNKYKEVSNVSSKINSPVSFSKDILPSVDTIHNLIDASNNLIDKIDISEIDRIKKSICTHLGVLDEFKSIISDNTNYGVESDFLEFKTSCVIPPMQISTGNDEEDMNLQQWNILKTICAFLNSESGGELLIGVNDSGFAVGLDGDIDKVRKFLARPTLSIEGLRTSYLKLFVDKAFATIDGKIDGTAITMDKIKYEIESNNKGVCIIRIKIPPYEGNVVKIIAPNRPQRFTDCYLRTSGASIPLTKEGLKELQRRKLRQKQSIL